MKTSAPLILCLLALMSCSSKDKNDRQVASVDKKTIGTLPTEVQPDLESIAEFRGTQVTGVTAAPLGRMFASFPRWRKNVPFSVVEIKQDGSYSPYPDSKWNEWDGKPHKNRFTCVQSVLADGESLYVLDPSSPELKEVVGRAKLFVFDLNTNQLKRTYEFDETVARNNPISMIFVLMITNKRFSSQTQVSEALWFWI